MKYFLDTSFIIALFNKKDQYHHKSIKLQNSFDDSDKFYLSDAIILEIGNSLSHPTFRQDIVAFIKAISKNDNFIIYPINPEIIDKGLKIYSTYKDKYRGLVDCISFSLMKTENISLALTTDNHFEQAGFKALLL